MSGAMMNFWSLARFKKYKNDWNYPIQVKHRKQNVIPDTKYSNFQSAMEFVIIIGQCFALNPVLGVSEKDTNNLRFKFYSWRCLYTLLSMIGQIGMICLLIISFFKTTFSTADSATSFIFYFLGVLTTSLFLRIATKWPKLCQLISNMEANDPTIENNLRIKFNAVCFLVLALASMEHLFAELNGLSIAVDCEPDIAIFESHTRRSFPWIFITIPSSPFIRAISHYSSPSFWRTMREDYNRATYLVRQVDSIIGGVIFVSFATNVYFVCSQLLHILSEGIRSANRCKTDEIADKRLMYGYEHSVYFVYSFIFLVARSLAVSLTAAQVHSASLKPAYALYDVSSSTYCIEIERFLEQIHGNTVALTGLQFFSVKRGLLLTIAGTIVTYELVLMQFTGVTPTSTSSLP